MCDNQPLHVTTDRKKAIYIISLVIFSVLTQSPAVQEGRGLKTDNFPAPL